MSSEVKANKLSPATGTALQISDSGDTTTIPSGATLDVSSATMTGFTIPSGQTLTVASGGTITNSGTATGFGGGKVVQVVTTTVTTGVSTTNTMSFEQSSAFTNTDGVEFMTATITPVATANRLTILCNWMGTHSASMAGILLAVFQDSTTNPLSATALKMYD